MKITINKNPNPVKFENFELDEPNVGDWIAATEGGAHLGLSADGTLKMDNGTLTVLKNLVASTGKIDGKKLTMIEVNNLPLGFYISLLGELLGGDSYLMESAAKIEEAHADIEV